MDIFSAIENRRSCRDFLPDRVDGEAIDRILAAASWAPSPLNSQPWEFIVITDPAKKGEIFDEANRCCQSVSYTHLRAHETS